MGSQPIETHNMYSYNIGMILVVHAALAVLFHYSYVSKLVAMTSTLLIHACLCLLQMNYACRYKKATKAVAIYYTY